MYEAQRQALSAAGANIGTSAPTAAARPLEGLSIAALRVNSAAVTIQAFLDRFHGDSGIEDTAGRGPEIEATPPYNVSLDRLLCALDRLEARVNDLTKIG
jgi:uncharacterized lipoprotein